MRRSLPPDLGPASSSTSGPATTPGWSCAGPFSINTADPATGIVTLHFRTVGRGTEWLTRVREGERIDMLGPLGRPFEVDPRSHNLLLVAGGLGMAGVRMLADEAVRDGRKVTILFGALSASHVYPSSLLPDEVEYVVATDDGSLGHHGFVTELVPDYEAWADQAFACGPHPMLKRLAALAAGRRDRLGVAKLGRKRGAGADPLGSTAARRKSFLQVSMEQRMGLPGLSVIGVPGLHRHAGRVDGPSSAGERVRARSSRQMRSPGSRSREGPGRRRSPIKALGRSIGRRRSTSRRDRRRGRGRPGAPPSPRPTMSEREALDRIDLSVDLAPARGRGSAPPAGEPDPRRLGHVRLRRRIRRGRRRPAPRRDLLQGHDAAAAGRKPAAARHRDAGRDAQLDRPAEPGRRRGHREVRPDLGRAGRCRSSSTSPANRSRTTSRSPAASTACPAWPGSS